MTAGRKLKRKVDNEQTGIVSQIWTVGHSTRTAEDLLDLLREHSIKALVDVRSFPGSRRYPHFNKEELSNWVPSAGIEYIHMPVLGGRRKPRADSRNAAWQNAGFRGYADYMETSDFQNGVEKLLEVACAKPTAIMCAEALWWRCHRGLIADYLKVRGIGVIHIIAAGKSEDHPFTSAARIVEGRLSYEGLMEGMEG